MRLKDALQEELRPLFVCGYPIGMRELSAVTWDQVEPRISMLDSHGNIDLNIA
jgi:hypothetical protein